MTERVKATWTVFELINGADVYAHGDTDPDVALETNAIVLVEHDANIVARTGVDACWHVAETQLKDRATSNDPPVLTASRNGTQHGLTEARPYALKQTVERVK